MRPRAALALLAATLLLGGCALVPRQPSPPPEPPTWLAAPAIWRIRQVVLIEIGEVRFPVQGLLELDTAAGTVRLAALDDLAVTLFRLTVTRTGERVDYMMPLVPRGADTARSVAASLRRIYLEPVAAVAGVATVILEAGADDRVASARPRAGDQWQTWYADYADAGGVDLPREIRYREKDGVRLTIRQQDARRIER